MAVTYPRGLFVQNLAMIVIRGIAYVIILGNAVGAVVMTEGAGSALFQAKVWGDLLWPAIAPGVRIVAISSAGHQHSRPSRIERGSGVRFDQSKALTPAR